MRSILTILLIFFSLATQAQELNPVGVANTYTLSNADGYPGNNYVEGLEYAPSGKVYAKDFFGDFHITGNNYIKYVPGLKDVANGSILYVLSNNEAWLIDASQNIIVIKNDSVWKTIMPPAKDPTGIASFSQHKRTYCMEIRGENLILYELKGYAWKRSFDIPFYINFNPQRFGLYVTAGGKMELMALLPDGNRTVYEIDTTHLKLKYLATIHVTGYSTLGLSLYNNHWKKNEALIKSLKDFMSERLPYYGTITDKDLGNHFKSLSPYPAFLFGYGNGFYEYFAVDSNHINLPAISFETRDKLNYIMLNPAYPYLTVSTEDKPFRVFPYIKKYPRIYNHDNSKSIFTLAQDDKGRIWAGSYQNGLSIVDDPVSPNHAPKIIRLKKQRYPLMNASLNYDGKIYLVGETDNGGILRYNMDGRMTKVAPQLPTGFYLYLAPKGQTVYYPSDGPSYPVYYCNVKELEKPFVHWKKLDTTQGILPFGMATMTEDTLGRIWMGHPKKGFAVYNPETKKGITYRTRNHETPVGFISCLTDKRGTVWMGSDNHGLWYYNDYHQAPTPAHIHQINQPLLNATKRITSMAIYKNWLVMGCYDKVCLLNLDSFYQKKKIILRYLSPQETAFTSYTEQNTMLVSKVDSSIWFSTSDMLYRWDIKTWLHLPVYRAKVKTFIQYNHTREEMSASKKLRLSAYIHGFDIVFEYLTPDGLPRFTRTAFVRQGDSLIFTGPGMQSSFSYQNLNSGAYTFYIQIFEQDGTTSTYRYPFFINKFIWQRWWFWVLVCILFFTPFIFWLNASRKRALQEREMSRLNVVTMSSQFRPHFILNALNTIGADLKDKPGAESIISRLGESINLIFNYAQQKKAGHSLEEEWMLLKNVIEIHRVIYLPELEVEYTGEELLNTYKNTEVPMGILEIHVENALLHGLRNKQSPPYKLHIAVNTGNNNLHVEITDNGIGRQRAMNISGYQRHGTGTKNLDNILNILNRFNRNKIEVEYIDLPQEDNSGGTIVNIKIPLDYKYRY